MKVKMYRSVLGQDGYASIVSERGTYVCDGRKAFASPNVIADFCRAQIHTDALAEEKVYAFALDTRMHLMGVFEVSSGSCNASFVPVREVFQKLLSLNAVCFALVHNHPSGDPTPSGDDNAVTERLRECGKLLGVELVDHVIVGNYGPAYSMTANEYV